MSDHSRRSFLKSLSAGLGASVFGSAVVSSDVSAGMTKGKGGSRAEFLHGVASGDPLADRLIIWTRVTPKNQWRRRVTIPVGWEVALDPDFRKIVRRGVTIARRSRDYTVKVDLVRLSPGTVYYYRFKSWNSDSRMGVGKTLPEGDVSQIRMAVMSCSNYPAGYFNVYHDVAGLSDLDAILHLGDYIYEYGEGGYATENADAIGRSFLPGNNAELLRLADYRARYSQYRSDSDCQAMHAATSFICVWDDHEVANDAWKDGAENHNEGEGSFERRKRSAVRAYYEWMPIRPPGRSFLSEEIYRRFDFGNLLSLHMLDTRVIGRDQQLDYANYINADGSFDQQAYVQDLTDPARTLLGAEQLGWLQSGLASSTAKWQVLGQQVLMGRMEIPVELLFGLANPGADLLLQFEELAIIKARLLQGDPTVTEAERLRVETTLPYNQDAWDGYPTDREVVLGTCLATDKNLITLAGDTHNAWANNIKDLAGNKAGVEFATASVTSPGLEAFLGLSPDVAPSAELAITLLIDELKYLNAADRGYLLVTFSHDEVVADWRFVDNILSNDYSVKLDRSRTLKVLPGPSGRELLEV